MTITLHRGYLPGAIGTITALHATYYAQHWGLSAFFEANVDTRITSIAWSPDGTALGATVCRQCAIA